MIDELFSVIESAELDGQFGIAANTTGWLYHWIGCTPAVLAIEKLVLEDKQLTGQLAERALDLFRQPSEPACRIEYEAAVCCYAFVLSRSFEESARSAIEEMQQDAGPEHGWLRPLLNRCLAFSADTRCVSTEDVIFGSDAVVLETANEWTFEDAEESVTHLTNLSRLHGTTTRTAAGFKLPHAA